MWNTPFSAPCMLQPQQQQAHNTVQHQYSNSHPFLFTLLFTTFMYAKVAEAA